LSIFYEKFLFPSPTLILNVPKNFNSNWVVLIKNAQSNQVINTEHLPIPFSSHKVYIDVNVDGVAYVQNVDNLQHVTAVLSGNKKQNFGGKFDSKYAVFYFAQNDVENYELFLMIESKFEIWLAEKTKLSK
jgi:hypothetical protein